MLNKFELRKQAKFNNQQLWYPVSFLKNLQKLLQQLHFKIEPTIATYCPQEFEANCRDITRYFASNGLKVLLPVISKDFLLFNLWNKNSHYIKNKYGIFEIDSKEFYTPNIIIAPLLAFDKRRNRLGHGGGYYDRTLGYYKNTNVSPLYIGLAYSFQEVGAIMVDQYDIPMDYIVCENDII